MHSHTKASPRAQDVYQLFPLHSRAAKGQAWEKGLIQEKASADALTGRNLSCDGARRKNGLFVYRFGLILAKFEPPAAPQKIDQRV